MTTFHVVAADAATDVGGQGSMICRERAEMYRVDITADLNEEDETGCVWTFLDEARDPEQIKPGAIIVAGDQDAAAVCEVIDLAPAGDGTIVHLRAWWKTTALWWNRPLAS